jgi:hypothetical protein
LPGTLSSSSLISIEETNVQWCQQNRCQMALRWKERIESSQMNESSRNQFSVWANTCQCRASEVWVVQQQKRPTETNHKCEKTTSESSHPENRTSKSQLDRALKVWRGWAARVHLPCGGAKGNDRKRKIKKHREKVASIILEPREEIRE